MIKVVFNCIKYKIDWKICQEILKKGMCLFLGENEKSSRERQSRPKRLDFFPVSVLIYCSFDVTIFLNWLTSPTCLIGGRLSATTLSAFSSCFSIAVLYHILQIMQALPVKIVHKSAKS